MLKYLIAFALTLSTLTIAHAQEVDFTGAYPTSAVCEATPGLCAEDVNVAPPIDLKLAEKGARFVVFTLKTTDVTVVVLERDEDCAEFANMWAEANLTCLSVPTAHPQSVEAATMLTLFHTYNLNVIGAMNPNFQ